MMNEEKLLRFAEVIAKQLELQNPMSYKFVQEALEAIQVFDKKHSERGLSGYGDFGPVGVAARMAEKYELLKEHYIIGEKLSSDVVEKLWQDIAVYGIMGKLVESGEWG